VPALHPSQTTSLTRMKRNVLDSCLSRRAMLSGAAAFGLGFSSLASFRQTGTVFAQDAAEPIKIGALYNLSGSLSSLDLPAQNGSLLAAKQINDAGGVLDRLIELIPYDGASNITTVTLGAKHLIEVEGVSLLLGLTDTSFVLAAGQIAQDAGVPFIDVGGTAPVITSIGNNIFMLPFGDNVQASAGAEYAASMGWKTCAILYDEMNTYPSVLANYFKHRWTMDDLGGVILIEESFQPGDSDIIPQLASIQSMAPDASFLYAAAMPDRIGAIVEQARDIGILQPILSGDGCDTPLLIESAGEHSNGVVFTNHVGLLGGSEAGNLFAGQFEQEYGAPPESAFASLGYDGVNLAVDAIKRAGTSNRTDIRAALEITQGFSGITGVISYEPGNRVPNKSVAIVELVDEQQELVETLLPANVVGP
jgi:branched-chain amino acid transport system substrate-binding protein